VLASSRAALYETNRWMNKNWADQLNCDSGFNFMDGSKYNRTIGARNMKKAIYLLMLLAVASTVAHAQSGCEDSPENPTIVLALLGSVGAGIAVLRRRFNSKQ
jgi:XrtJ-associated TM-motif-TM protein